MAKWFLVLAYGLTVYAANWAIVTFGLIPVGLGLLAPAGVIFAGLSFTLRDAVQHTSGKRWSVIAIALGAALSGLLSPALAAASGGAFLLSETADLLIYTPLRRRTLLGAVVASNVVGLVVDSALFLWLAFGSLDFLAGNVLGKVWMTLLTVVTIVAWRATRARLSSWTYLRAVGHGSERVATDRSVGIAGGNA